MAGNKSLGAARVAKEDEFYTQLTDVEKELMLFPLSTYSVYALSICSNINFKQ